MSAIAHPACAPPHSLHPLCFLTLMARRMDEDLAASIKERLATEMSRPTTPHSAPVSPSTSALPNFQGRARFLRSVKRALSFGVPTGRSAPTGPRSASPGSPGLAVLRGSSHELRMSHYDAYVMHRHRHRARTYSDESGPVSLYPVESVDERVPLNEPFPPVLEQHGRLVTSHSEPNLQEAVARVTSVAQHSKPLD